MVRGRKIKIIEQAGSQVVETNHWLGKNIACKCISKTTKNYAVKVSPILFVNMLARAVQFFEDILCTIIMIML